MHVLRYDLKQGVVMICIYMRQKNEKLKLQRLLLHVNVIHSKRLTRKMKKQKQKKKTNNVTSCKVLHTHTHTRKNVGVKTYLCDTAKIYTSLNNYFIIFMYVFCSVTNAIVF